MAISGVKFQYFAIKLCRYVLCGVTDIGNTGAFISNFFNLLEEPIRTLSLRRLLVTRESLNSQTSVLH